MSDDQNDYARETMKNAINATQNENAKLKNDYNSQGTNHNVEKIKNLEGQSNMRGAGGALSSAISELSGHHGNQQINEDLGMAKLSMMSGDSFQNYLSNSGMGLNEMQQGELTYSFMMGKEKGDGSMLVASIDNLIEGAKVTGNENRQHALEEFRETYFGKNTNKLKEYDE